MKHSCASRWGTCLRDPRCQDTACEGHPTQTCSTCAGGPCTTPQACHQPLIELQPIRRRLFTQRRLRVSRAFMVGALFAIPGVALFAVEGLRYFLRH